MQIDFHSRNYVEIRCRLSNLPDGSSLNCCEICSFPKQQWFVSKKWITFVEKTRNHETTWWLANRALSRQGERYQDSVWCRSSEIIFAGGIRCGDPVTDEHYWKMVEVHQEIRFAWRWCGRLAKIYQAFKDFPEEINRKRAAALWASDRTVWTMILTGKLRKRNRNIFC